MAVRLGSSPHSRVPRRPAALARRSNGGAGLLAPQTLRTLIDLVTQHQIAELIIESHQEKVKITRTNGVTRHLSDSVGHGWPYPVCAPAVGRWHWHNVWQRPVQPGDVLETGAVVGTVHALGVQHDVRSPVRGTLAAMFVQDGEAVEFGQPLALVYVPVATVGTTP